jgi:hypothetical protein
MPMGDRARRSRRADRVRTLWATEGDQEQRERGRLRGAHPKRVTPDFLADDFSSALAAHLKIAPRLAVDGRLVGRGPGVGRRVRRQRSSEAARRLPREGDVRAHRASNTPRAPRVVRPIRRTASDAGVGAAADTAAPSVGVVATPLMAPRGRMPMWGSSVRVRAGWPWPLLAPLLAPLLVPLRIRHCLRQLVASVALVRQWLAGGRL